MEFISNVLEDVQQCQKAQAVSISYIKLYVVLIGISVLGLCMAIIIPFIIFLQNRLNLLWNQIKAASKKDNNSLGHRCINRLEKFHNIKDININELEISNNRIKFGYIFKYLVRLSVFLMIGSVYYIIANYAFYVKLQSLLSNRPDMLYNSIIARSSLTKADYLIKQITVKGIIDFEILYSDNMPLNNDYESGLSEAIKNTLTKTQALLNPDYSELMGSNLYNIISRLRVKATRS
jgi:hypothetical protein